MAQTQKTDMITLSQVLEKLRQKKMDNEFRWENGAFTTGNDKKYLPEAEKRIVEKVIIKVAERGKVMPGAHYLLDYFKKRNFKHHSFFNS